jgi:UPF0755 protein
MLMAPIVAVLLLLLYVFCIQSPVSQTAAFTVSRGDSVTGVANRLYQNGLIDSVQTFKMVISAKGGKVQRGIYEIRRGASVWRVADMLANGKVAQTTIMIPEGLTVKQIKNRLLQEQGLTGDVDCVAEDNASVCSLKDGQLFPDTYTVARGTSRLAVLELARKKMQSVADKWIKTNLWPKPLKNWNEVITLASIVQKETPLVREMPVVASVYLNRLNKKMRLQADPTVVYALTNKLGDMQGKPLLRSHLKIDNPYNTYKNAGLPPAPIANVGLAAIGAVLNPAETNYLFFVADGRGGHKFSVDYETHKKNHSDWRKIKNKNNKK